MEKPLFRYCKPLLHWRMLSVTYRDASGGVVWSFDDPRDPSRDPRDFDLHCRAKRLFPTCAETIIRDHRGARCIAQIRRVDFTRARFLGRWRVPFLRAQTRRDIEIDLLRGNVRFAIGTENLRAGEGIDSAFSRFCIIEGFQIVGPYAGDSATPVA